MLAAVPQEPAATTDSLASPTKKQSVASAQPQQTEKENDGNLNDKDQSTATTKSEPADENAPAAQEDKFNDPVKTVEASAEGHDEAEQKAEELQAEDKELAEATTAASEQLAEDDKQDLTEEDQDDDDFDAVEEEDEEGEDEVNDEEEEEANQSNDDEDLKPPPSTRVTRASLKRKAKDSKGSSTERAKRTKRRGSDSEGDLSAHEDDLKEIDASNIIKGPRTRGRRVSYADEQVHSDDE